MEITENFENQVRKEIEIKKELEEIKIKAIAANATSAIKCVEYISAINDDIFWKEYSKLTKVHALTLMRLLTTKTGLRIGGNIVTMDKNGEITLTKTTDYVD